MIRNPWLLAAAVVIRVLLPDGVLAQPLDVSLEVRSNSWVAGSVFDRSDLEKQCSSAGIQFGTAVHGMVLIEYHEIRGSAYSLYGLGKPGGYGTVISYKLTLLSAKDARVLLVIESQASTPFSGVSMADLHGEALRAFKSSPQYQFSCSLVAAALGVRTEADKLLPWAVQNEAGFALLSKVGFSPASRKQEAFWAVAKGDFSTLSGYGSDAIEPLVLYIDSHHKTGPSGMRTATGKGAALAAAVGALAATRDPSSSAFLLDLLRATSRWVGGYGSEVPVAVLKALGDVGDAFALPELESWSKKDGETGRAATEALQRVRARVTKKGELPERRGHASHA